MEQLADTILKIFPCELATLNDTPYFLQTSFWGEFKSQFGWSAMGFHLEISGKSSKLLVLLRSIKGNLTLAYIPHGPWDEYFSPLPQICLTPDILTFRLRILAQALKPFLPKNVFVLRFDLLSGTSVSLDYSKDEENETFQNVFPQSLLKPFKKPAGDVQPPDTVILNLQLSEDEILGQMKKKTRYNIRLAQKKGVTVRQGGLDDIEQWYEIYKLTSQRDKIALHPFLYYKKLFELSKEPQDNTPQIFLLLAELEGNLLAGNVVLVNKKQGVYLYGASSNENRNVMAPYALQWAGIQLCKKLGCDWYDLFGIPPTDAPNHPMHGLYRFKTGFGGSIEHRQGAWDYVFKPFTWKILDSLQKIRIWYFKVWKKK